MSKDHLEYDDRLGRPTAEEAAGAQYSIVEFRLLPIMAAELREWYHSKTWKPTIGIDRQSKQHNDFWTAEAKYLFETIIFHSDVLPRVKSLFGSAGVNISANLKRTHAEVKADELAETAQERLGENWADDMRSLYRIRPADMEQIKNTIQDSELAETVLSIIGKPVFD